MSRTLRAALLSLAALAIAAPDAFAQDADDAPPVPPPVEEVEADAPEDRAAPDQPVHSPAAPQRPDADAAVWALVDEAMVALARDDEALAERLLRQIRDDYPGHPAAGAAGRALGALTGAIDAELTPPGDLETPRARAGRETGLARAELAIIQTIHGAALGGEICVGLDCDSARGYALSIGGGALAGLTLSLGLTHDGITPGHASLINSGTVWGWWNGLMLNLWLDDPADYDDDDQVFTYMALGQLVGTGVGVVLWGPIQPTAGDMGLTNTTAFWTSFSVFLLHASMEFDTDEQTIALTQLLAADLGLVAGGWLARAYPMSRGRTFIIDSGGVLGFLLGVTADVLIQGDSAEAEAIFAYGLAGELAGLGLATYLTRDWDVRHRTGDEEVDEVEAQLMLAPTPDGGVLGARGRW